MPTYFRTIIRNGCQRPHWVLASAVRYIFYTPKTLVAELNRTLDLLESVDKNLYTFVDGSLRVQRATCENTSMKYLQLLSLRKDLLCDELKDAVPAAVMLLGSWRVPKDYKDAVYFWIDRIDNLFDVFESNFGKIELLCFNL